MNRDTKLPHSIASKSETASFPPILLAIYVIAWIALAIAPLDRHDWLLENALPAIAIPLLIFTYRWQRFTNTTYTLLLVFMLLHAIGAHYTYAKVPYDDWFQTLSGHRLNDLLGLQRNAFDRLVHFLYGALLFPVFWELFAPHIDGRGWRYFLVGAFITSHAGIYEVIEWLAAAGFGGDLGTAYLGTQGDEWDAQKDMAMAMCGTLLTIAIMLLGDWRKASRRAH
ncbi:MAG: rane protein [Verrucomicrobiaceae bacterium]|nr:rane protein [Verrucomicrobiaceae bacterium]